MAASATRPASAPQPVRLRLSRAAQAGVAALVLFAIWLRLRSLGYTEIGVDQALTLNMALEWVHGGPLPLASMKSSFGVFNPPLVEYLYALPLFFKPDILGVTWLIALTNLAGVLVAGWATARVFGWRVGVWAMLLYAVNPWAVHYGRLIWMQSFVPFFAALLYACVLLYFTLDPRPIYLVLGLLCLSGVIQVHLTAIVLGPVLLIVGACFPRRLRAWPILVGGTFFLLSFAPFILFQIRSGFADAQALRAGLSQTSETNLAPVLIVLDLLQSKGIYATLGSAGDRWQSLDLLWLRADTLIAILLGLAVAAAVVSVASHFWRPETRGRLPPHAAGQLILLIWLCLPVLFFIRHSQYLQNYYFLYLYPLPFVLLALFFDRLYVWLVEKFDRLSASLGGRVGRQAASGVFLPLAVIAFQQGRLDVIGQNLRAMGVSGHARVLDVRRAIDFARQLMTERPDCQLVAMSEGAEYDSTRFALLREFVGPARVRFVEAGVGYLLPSPCALYFLSIRNPAAEVWLDAVAQPLPTYTLRTPEETWTFHDLPAADRMAALALWKSDAPSGEWANGVQLTRLAVQGDRRAGSTLTLVTTWKVNQPVPTHPIHFGQYLLTQDNVLVAQVDGPGMDSTQWRPGDVFETAFELALPSDLSPGEYYLAAALYWYPEIQRIPLANSPGDLLPLGGLTVSAP